MEFAAEELYRDPQLLQDATSRCGSKQHWFDSISMSVPFSSGPAIESYESVFEFYEGYTQASCGQLQSCHVGPRAQIIWISPTSFD